jgi:tetratricopeptide (TPR) repeat protein
LTASYAAAPVAPETITPSAPHYRMAAPLWETRAYTLNQQGVLHMFCGEFVLARQRFDEMFAIFLAHNEENGLACVAYQAVGRLCLYAGHYQEALTTLEQGLRIRQQRADREGIAVNSIYMGAAHLGLGQTAAVEPLLTVAFDACHALDNTHDLALCHLYLGALAFQRQQRAQVRTHWTEVTTIAGQVILHFVELRPWLRYLWPLLRQGEFALCRRLIATLWRSTRHDQLSMKALWRFLWI